MSFSGTHVHYSKLCSFEDMRIEISEIMINWLTGWIEPIDRLTKQ
jgi:hypothetical protein